jgi:hypothetical protein
MSILESLGILVYGVCAGIAARIQKVMHHGQGEKESQTDNTQSSEETRGEKDTGGESV